MNSAEILCKSALSSSSLSDTELSLNPYVGCEHACCYCYAPYVIHRDPDSWAKAKAKVNIAEVLHAELRSGKAYRKRVTLSTVTDPYQPLERRYELTRKCLTELLDYGAYISVQTKSSLVMRDVDIIKRFDVREVGFTMTSLAPFYEPGADPVEKRLEALRALKKEGIKTFVFIGPVIPGHTTKTLVEMIRDAEPDYVVVDRLRIKKGMAQRVRDICDTELNASELEAYAEDVRGMCRDCGLNLITQPLWEPNHGNSRQNTEP